MDEAGLLYGKPWFEMDFPGGESGWCRSPPGSGTSWSTAPLHSWRTNALVRCLANCCAAMTCWANPDRDVVLANLAPSRTLGPGQSLLLAVDVLVTSM